MTARLAQALPTSVDKCSCGYLVVEASLLCFPSVFLLVLCVFLLLFHIYYCSCVTMGPKISAKKSYEKRKKLITIEIRKKILDKHEKGTPSSSSRTNHPIFKIIKLIKPVNIISFALCLTILGKDSFP